MNKNIIRDIINLKRKIKNSFHRVEHQREKNSNNLKKWVENP